MTIKERARRVKVFLLDIDGVLTDGLIYHFVDTSGNLVELKGVNAQDSIALGWLAQCGIKTGVISGRNSRGMEERLKLVKVSYIHQGRLDKLNVFDQILKEAGVKAEEVLYMGDDWPDIPVLERAGLAVAVPNARPEVKAKAHWVTRSRGGEAAVREAAELVLRAQGLVDRVGGLR
ncbi:MAG: HAD hydrolase family protein [Elusimicrobia bacterium]|nr:HAD hydrolase family protein [Elusimicrobiota bacterium]